MGVVGRVTAAMCQNHHTMAMDTIPDMDMCMVLAIPTIPMIDTIGITVSMIQYVAAVIGSGRYSTRSRDGVAPGQCRPCQP